MYTSVLAYKNAKSADVRMSAHRICTVFIQPLINILYTGFFTSSIKFIKVINEPFCSAIPAKLEILDLRRTFGVQTQHTKEVTIMFGLNINKKVHTGGYVFQIDIIVYIKELDSRALRPGLQM